MTKMANMTIVGCAEKYARVPANLTAKPGAYRAAEHGDDPELLLHVAGDVLRSAMDDREVRNAIKRLIAINLMSASRKAEMDMLETLA